jgi:zinc transport system substrate-binding protein
MTSSSDHGSEHVHQLDPHFWLDPTLVKRHAHTVADALCELSPADCGHLKANLDGFHNYLDAVDRRVAATLAPMAGRDLFVFHPAYGYFADRYGLRQIAVEVGGKQPTPRQLAALIDGARASGVRALFMQPQFSGGSARALADAMGVALVELDPLAAEYAANLETMAARVVAAYGD